MSINVAIGNRQLQSHNAVTAYFTSKRILPSAYAKVGVVTMYTLSGNLISSNFEDGKVGMSQLRRYINPMLVQCCASVIDWK